MLLSIFLSLFYFSFFLFIISRASFFNLNGFSKKYLYLIFGLKVLFGIVLIEIYSHFYHLRSTADAFKYYDDAKVIYAALFEHPWDYFRMTFGINSDAAELFPYYQKMNNWYLSDDYTFYNDCRFVIRFNALVFPFAFGKYVVHMIFMCFLSFTGLVALFKAFHKPFSDKVFSLAFAVFLVPSVLFWGSGVLKEGLILFSSGFLTFYFFQLLNQNYTTKKLLFFLLFFILLAGIKVHILLSLLPGFGILFWHRKYPQITLYKKVILSCVLALVIAFSISISSEKYNPFRMLAQKQKDFINLANGGFYFESIDQKKDTFFVEEKHRVQIMEARDSLNWKLKDGLVYYRWSKGNICDTLHYSENTATSFRLLMHLDSSGSKIKLTPLEPTIWSTIKGIPRALVNTLFRPTLWEVNNLLSLFAALENLLFLGLFIFVLLFFKFPKAEEQEIFVFCSSFVFILFVIIGLTTPVLGAMVRYKIPALPYLVMIFMILTDQNKWRKKLPRLSKLINQAKF